MSLHAQRAVKVRTQPRFSRASLAGLARAAVAKTARKRSLNFIVNEVVVCEV